MYWNMLPKDSIYCPIIWAPSGIYIGFFISREWPYHGITYPENIDEVDIFADLARNK
jgi:hypothetical protein